MRLFVLCTFVTGLCFGCGNPSTTALVSKRTLDDGSVGQSNAVPEDVRDHERGCYPGSLHLDHEGCADVEAQINGSSGSFPGDNTADAIPEPSTAPAPQVDPPEEAEEVVQASPSPSPQNTLDPAANGDPNIVVFRISAGSGGQSWNDRDSMVVATVGQTIRFVNDDSVRHRLHTNGSPCPHGANFAPGETFDCVVTRAFDPDNSGPLYDHNDGPSSEVWIKSIPAPAQFGLTSNEGAAEAGHCNDH